MPSASVAASITLPRDKLVEAFERALVAVDKKPLMPAASCAMLVFTKEFLEVTTTNFEMAVRATIPFTGEWEEDNFVVNAKAFSDYVSRLDKDQPVRLFKKGANGLGISSGRSRGEMRRIMPTADFPPIGFKPRDGERTIKVGSADLKAALKQVSFVADAKAVGRPAVTCIHFGFKPEESVLMLNTVSSAMAARRAMNAEGDRELFVALPVKLTDNFVKMLPAEGEVSLFLNEFNQCMFAVDGATCLISQIKMEPPVSIKSIVDSALQDAKSLVRVERQALINAIHRSAVFGGVFESEKSDVDTFITISLEPQKGIVVVGSGDKSQTGASSSDVDAEIEGPELNRLYSYKQVIAGLGSFGGDVLLTFGKDNSPILISDRADQRQVFLSPEVVLKLNRTVTPEEAGLPASLGTEEDINEPSEPPWPEEDDSDYPEEDPDDLPL